MKKSFLLIIILSLFFSCAKEPQNTVIEIGESSKTFYNHQCNIEVEDIVKNYHYKEINEDTAYFLRPTWWLKCHDTVYYSIYSTSLGELNENTIKEIREGLMMNFRITRNYAVYEPDFFNSNKYPLIKIVFAEHGETVPPFDVPNISYSMHSHIGQAFLPNANCIEYPQTYFIYLSKNIQNHEVLNVITCHENSHQLGFFDGGGGVMGNQINDNTKISKAHIEILKKEYSCPKFPIDDRIGVDNIQTLDLGLLPYKIK